MQTRNCTQSAQCDPRFAQLAVSTVMIYTVEGVNSASCTGTLVSNFEGTATYVLTADHCFTSKQPLRAMGFTDARHGDFLAADLHTYRYSESEKYIYTT